MSIDEALCILRAGWHTEEQHNLYLKAERLVLGVARQAYIRQEITSLQIELQELTLPPEQT